MPSRLLALLLASLSACATPPSAPVVPTTEVRALLANGPVVAGESPPEIALEGFARGKLEGAGIGAAGVFGACVAGLVYSGCGAYCGPLLAFWLGLCASAMAVGSVVGAVVAPSAQTVREAEGPLLSALEAHPMQLPLRDAVLASARGAGVDLAPESPARADARLEVALTRVGTEGGGIDPPLSVVMSARARILAESDGAELFAADYRYQGEKRRLGEWSAERCAPLLRALETGYETLGAEIFEDVFRLYPFPDRDVHASGPSGSAFGLAPLAPTGHGRLARVPWIGRWFERPEVEGLLPELRWQSFPRETDSAARPAEMGRVTNVRYDLVVAREKDSAPDEVVYRREGLTAPEHRLEQPLAAATGYFWTVRARFELDGRTQLGEWSGTRPPTDAHLEAPSRSSFRFRTP